MNHDVSLSTGDFPGLSRAFVHERDIFLTHSLQVAVEAGKRERMRKNLDQVPV